MGGDCHFDTDWNHLLRDEDKGLIDVHACWSRANVGSDKVLTDLF
jgi:hypothetical protein